MSIGTIPCWKMNKKYHEFYVVLRKPNISAFQTFRKIRQIGVAAGVLVQKSYNDKNVLGKEHFFSFLEVAPKQRENL